MKLCVYTITQKPIIQSISSVMLLVTQYGRDTTMLVNFSDTQDGNHFEVCKVGYRPDMVRNQHKSDLQSSKMLLITIVFCDTF